MTTTNKRRPCLRCGLPTCTSSRICRSCEPIAPGKRPEYACIGCGTRTLGKDKRCKRCRVVIPPVTPPEPDDELTGGRWLVVRGVKRYVPNGHGYDWIVQREAKTKRDRALSMERLISRWWERPPVADDPQVIARRLAELAADFERVDQRTREVA